MTSRAGSAVAVELGAGDVVEEFAVAGTEVVQAGVAAGDELHEFAADAFEEAVDFERLLGGGSVEAGEDVGTDVSTLEGLDADDDLVEGGGLPSCIRGSGVELLGAGDA